MIMAASGRIVILNGAPRAGKSSIARLIQQFEGCWINLGVDTMMAATPEKAQPGIGLRPGGERPDLESLIAKLYAALFDSIAAHARHGLDVVADLGIHDGYARPLGILGDCARRLAGLPVLLVRVTSPIETIMARRNAGQAGREGRYATAAEGEPVPAPVLRWQQAMMADYPHDLSLDTEALSSEACAKAIAEALAHPPTPSALARLAVSGEKRG